MLSRKQTRQEPRRHSTTWGNMQLREEFNGNLFVLSSLMIATLKVQCQASTENVLTQGVRRICMQSVNVRSQAAAAISATKLCIPVISLSMTRRINPIDRQNWSSLHFLWIDYLALLSRCLIISSAHQATVNKQNQNLWRSWAISHLGWASITIELYNLGLVGLSKVFFLLWTRNSSRRQWQARNWWQSGVMNGGKPKNALSALKSTKIIFFLYLWMSRPLE